MNIGQAALHSGLPQKTIRYYEDIGLVSPLRTSNGYRVFLAKDLHKLAFIGRARTLGFSIEDCRTLLELYDDASRESATVKEIAQAHLAQIDEKVAQLQAMRNTLSHLIRSCRGDHRPDCPILEDLSLSSSLAD